MSDQQYIEFKNLSDWEDDTYVVVHILSDGRARVRSHYPNRQSAEQSLVEALEEAHRFVRQDPNKQRVAIYLSDGAQWDDRYGILTQWQPDT